MPKYWGSAYYFSYLIHMDNYDLMLFSEFSCDRAAYLGIASPYLQIFA